MDCEAAETLLSARLDGPIDPQEALALEEHLSGCDECRAAGGALASQHIALRSAFAPRRRAAAEMGEIVAARISARRSRWRWLPIVAVACASAAAGFLVALRLPVTHPALPTAPRPDAVAATSYPSELHPAARLALCTGAVQIKDPADADWRIMETGGVVPAQASVRTGPNTRCEFQLPGGSLIRLDEQSQVRFDDAGQIQLASGQVFSTTGNGAAAPVISIAQASVTCQQAQFDLSRQGDTSRLIVLEGTTTVAGRQKTIARSGESVRIVGGEPGAPERLGDLLLATRWVNELLMMKGRDTQELDRRVDDLMAQIGGDKMDFLYEEEIRALGDHCVVPLTRFIQSPRSAGREQKRWAAARIIRDVAQPWNIPHLIELLEDHDGEVRASAAEALVRLTGSTQGISPDRWRTAAPDALQPRIQQWQQWWEQNHVRFPGAQQIHPPLPRTKA